MMNTESERMLILAASSRDAQSTAQVLSYLQIDAVRCENYDHLEAEITRGAGGIILAKEALSEESVQRLALLLENQPTWSFIPIILLISAGDLALGNESALNLLKPLRNATFLERPVRVGALVSVVQNALGDRRRQYKVRKLLNDLEKSKQVAEEANRAKTTFLANMSHEIRTPLGAILGFSELMMDESTEESEKMAYLHTVKRNGQLLLALVDDILDLAKVEAGHVSVERIELSFNELISEVISALEPKASAKNIPLITTGQSRVPLFIKTDPVRFKQVLMNVIGNAIKFTSAGHIVIHFSHSIDSQKPDVGRLKVTVSDTGVGISPEQRQRLFQPFSQADNSITRKYGGTGLGLVLSKKLAELLGGDLQLLRSEPDQGSTFEMTIEFGVVPISQKIMPASLESSQLPFGQQLLGRRILLVDDSRDNQALIGRMLTLSGATVETADNGVQAMEKCMSGQYHVVLMDIQMPVLGGEDATQRLRAQGYSTPIIALTAHALREDRERCLRVGCNDYLTKPVHRQELIRVVGQHAGAQNTAETHASL